jgi:tRNA(fMet)-specific endonuclease VapC
MYLLDTDTYTHLLLDRAEVVANVAKANAAGELIGITVVTKVEILGGRMDALLKATWRERFLAMQRQLSMAEAALQHIGVAMLDDVALDYFERPVATRGLGKVGRADLLIASIVLAQDATLVTRNVRHFRLIPQLKHVNWVD